MENLSHLLNRLPGMGRPHRYDYEGAWHHVMNQVTAKAPAFGSDRDRHFFLGLLANLENRFGVEVHAYVLMGNHYHLLVRSRDNELSRAMHWLGTTYAGYFNTMTGRVGAFFRGRYQSRLIEDERYRAWVGAYIHLNPVNDGFVANPGDWAWSSHRASAGMEPRPEWLRTRVLRGSQSCAAYNEFVCEYVAETDSSAANDPATLASDWALEIGEALNIASVERLVAEEFNVSVDHLYESSPGSPLSGSDSGPGACESQHLAEPG
jgi:REP element-mobilizing transposase RayT